MRLKPVNDLIFPVGLFPEDIFQPLFLFLIYSPEFLIFIVYDDDTRFGGRQFRIDRENTFGTVLRFLNNLRGGLAEIVSGRNIFHDSFNPYRSEFPVSDEFQFPGFSSRNKVIVIILIILFSVVVQRH